MNAAEENLTEKVVVRVPAEKPVSVYSVNFARVINNLGGKRFIQKRNANAASQSAPKTLFGKIFKRRNAVAVAAILAIGVLHFTFQISFISREVSKNRPAVEVPPVKIEPARVAPVEIPSSEFELKKIDAPLQQKSARTSKKEAEIAPVKPQPRKKEATESRAERLRRAEKILTGI